MARVVACHRAWICKAGAGVKIALLGAESTGKSALARALAARLQTPNQSAVAVDEYLRAWCEQHQRTPQRDEQLHIADEQQRRIENANVHCNTVLADTTPLMTAVYSDYVFGDKSLYAAAIPYQRSFDLTLVTGLDIAWQPDGIQRDGPHVRDAVDAMLRGVLDFEKIVYRVVYGLEDGRTNNALNAIHSVALCALSTGAASQKSFKKWQWACDKCSDPDCEHKLFTSLQKTG